ncbi:MAG: hypothetical protein GXP48_12675 [Acidobacteria bacterium]|nr:hypothetical protein [Acidobacteriota bacterium]
MNEEKNFPTMIIPSGTEIKVNDQGQLSIRTPGNLVIQNSGVYSMIESGQGSVRIDPQVKVEAVSVQAADSCFIAGELTAWRVKASKITLEKSAVACIMLQESEQLELERGARLVGNFASNKELYLMLGKFSQQLRRLPQSLASGDTDAGEPFLAAAVGGTVPEAQEEADEPFVTPDGEHEPSPSELQQRQEVLSLSRVVVQRELGRPDLDASGREALESLQEMILSGRLDDLRREYGYLLSQVNSPSDDLLHARQMLERVLGEESDSSSE